MKVRAVYVGRHKLLPAQERALRELSLEVVRRVENLPTEPQSLQKLLQELKSQGVEAVVTIALPPHLLAPLTQSFKTYVFEMKSFTVESVAEAEHYVAENPEFRTYLPGRLGEPVRVLEFQGISEVKVVIESKKVWPR
jgi:hypothetical protein